MYDYSLFLKNLPMAMYSLICVNPRACHRHSVDIAPLQLVNDSSLHANMFYLEHSSQVLFSNTIKWHR